MPDVQTRIPQGTSHSEGLRNHRFLDLRPSTQANRDEVARDLLASPKRLLPKYFYDERGSRQHVGEECVLIEPGSGNSEKVRYLLDQGAGFIERYVAIDIDGTTVADATLRIAQDYPDVDVWGVCGNLTELERVPGFSEIRRSANVLFFPGSTLGNFNPEDSLEFLRKARLVLGPTGRVLLGLDRRKAKPILDAAYNDSQGVTAAFNKNVLAHLNAQAGGNFDLDTFEHLAYFDETKGRVEMHLRSLRNQIVRVAGVEISLRAGETIHTENSYKYDPAQVASLASSAGFENLASWSDDEELFTVYLLQARLG